MLQDPCKRLPGLWYAITKDRMLDVTPQDAVDEILVNMMDFVIITDDKGLILKVNKQGEKLLGVSQSRLKNNMSFYWEK